MIWFVTTIHVTLCIILMIVILLQAGKGAEIGAVFGGSSQTIFGSRGAATFLSKVTSFCAIGFMITSLALVYLHSRSASQSLMDTPVTTTGESETTGGKTESDATETTGVVPQEEPATSDTAANQESPRPTSP